MKAGHDVISTTLDDSSHSVFVATLNSKTVLMFDDLYRVRGNSFFKNPSGLKSEMVAFDYRTASVNYKQ